MPYDFLQWGRRVLRHTADRRRHSPHHVLFVQRLHFAAMALQRGRQSLREQGEEAETRPIPIVKNSIIGYYAAPKSSSIPYSRHSLVL